MPFAKLVSAHGGVLVFLQAPSRDRGVWLYCCVRLGYLIFEGRVPAKENQGRDDQNFSQ